MVAKTRLHHGSVKIALTFLKRENHEIVCLAQRVFQRRDRWATSALAPIANSGTPLGTFKRKAVEKSRQQINDPRNISCRDLGKIASARTSRKCSRKMQLLSSRRKAEKQTFRLWVYGPTSASLRNIETEFTRKVIVTDERARKNAENAARCRESQRGLNERTDPNRPKSLRLKRRFACRSPAHTGCPGNPWHDPNVRSHA
jgi:hypothetical protein